MPCIGHSGLLFILFSYSSKELPTEVTVIWHLAPSLGEKSGHMILSAKCPMPESESVQKHGRRKLIAVQWTLRNGSWNKSEIQPRLRLVSLLD